MDITAPIAPSGRMLIRYEVERQARDAVDLTFYTDVINGCI